MSVTIIWSAYLAMQYAFIGIAQSRKAKGKTSIGESNPHKEGHTPILLLEAMPVCNESKDINTIYEAGTDKDISEEIAVTNTKVVSEEANPDNDSSIVSAPPANSTYQQGIDDFYQSQAECQKKRIQAIHEYILYTMSPFIYEEDMDEFCTDLLSFVIDHNYRPKAEPSEQTKSAEREQTPSCHARAGCRVHKHSPCDHLSETRKQGDSWYKARQALGNLP